MNNYALAIHGGSGVKMACDYAQVQDHLTQLIQKGEKLLLQKNSAIDVVEQIVSELEASGLYVAGRGSIKGKDGAFEMDAALMDGATGEAGSVAAIENIISPIKLARYIMEKTPHIMFTGEGAKLLAKQVGFAFVEDFEYFVLPIGVTIKDMQSEVLSHGTVGCVALDQYGNLASGTSTGGVFGKAKGRVGDCPIIGSGTWADKNVAVSCTGLGEYFIKKVAGFNLASKYSFLKSDLALAANQVMDEIKLIGGDGGLIALDKNGNIAMPIRSTGMKRAAVRKGQKFMVEIY